MNDERWALVEIMGKRQHIGKLSEVFEFGRVLVHVDELQRDGSFLPRRYAPDALFGYMPMSEQRARELIVPRRGFTCESFKRSEVLSDRCSDCGRTDAEHVPATPQLPAHDDAPSSGQRPSDAPPSSEDDDEDDIPW
jgi:hypothetical protein